MYGLNHVVIIGSVGKKEYWNYKEMPSTRPGKDQNYVLNFKIAYNTPMRNKDGSLKKISVDGFNKQVTETNTEWFPVTAWGRLALNCREHFFPGMKISVEGRLSTRQWDDENGKTRSSTEIIASSIVFLSKP